jgi:hypothetical protein
MGEEGDIAIGVLTVDDFGAHRACDPQSFHACGDTPIRSDFDWRADTPNVSPPRAAWGWAQDVLFMLLGAVGGGIRRATDFPMDFLGVTMMAENG